MKIRNRIHLISIIIMTMLLTTPSFSKEKTKVACIGNSVTFGATIKDRDHDNYPTQLQEMLGDSFLVGNFGHSGARLMQKGPNPYIQTEAYQKALQFHADIFVIHLGLNDTDPRNWPHYRDRFVSDFYALIDTLKASSHHPNPQFYICKESPVLGLKTFIPLGRIAWYDQIVETTTHIASQRDIPVIDFYSPLVSRPDLLTDGLHPNGKGATLLAHEVAKYVGNQFPALTLPSIFQDGMVLQRNQPIHLWGEATPKEEVKIKFLGERYQTKTRENGKWSIYLPKQKVEKDQEMTISTSKKQIHIKEISIGDVWLCSGQSNMSFPLRSSQHGEKAIQKATNENIHIYSMETAHPTNNTA
ncbi:hypothetical protein K4L44_05985 [Halosquirtibacter laminarini]|uniref:Uncharacterized protein n=1 Tax=Halosquirtibacter laminarini TaxID=3374600 RepID=A0AC61NPF9_9BACT|nr:hypothetical protein K4L44_05985 [Prolixibacteraceae bacterium]